jgi:hypothetical protein
MEKRMAPMLGLYEDVLSSDGQLTLAAAPRMIFVTHGAIAVDGRATNAGEAWHGQGAVTVTGGPEGASCWRWDFLPHGAPPALAPETREKLVARLDTLPKGDLLLRGDSVGFPPGGCAYLHRHQGPGIRCLIEGGIRIDTDGGSTSYGPGGAWYESGPDAVFAQAADRPSRFIRVMLLPRSLLGKSSIAYVNEDDKAKPKSQQYRIFVDVPIGL